MMKATGLSKSGARYVINKFRESVKVIREGTRKMANSSLDKVIQDFNRRFAEPLLDFYKRRIVVWIDKDQEFADKLDTINGVKVVALTGSVAGILFMS